MNHIQEKGLKSPFSIFMKTVSGYLKKRWLPAAVIGYMIFACILKLTTGFNITVPCLYNKIFNIHCPGCGLTTAFINLLKLDFRAAWNLNPLIYIVIPFGSYLIIRDYLKFKKVTSTVVS